MGIKNFTKFLEKYAPNSIKHTKITDYIGETIGIDANLLLYKLIYGIRVNGYDIMNGKIIVTHIHSLLLKLLAFRRYNIYPVFVFDTGAPEIKYKTFEERKRVKQKLIETYQVATTDKGKRIYYYVKSDITDQEVQDCKDLIKIFGYNIVDAKEEADAQLAQLYKNRSVTSIASDDMDILLFGGGILLKNFTINEHKKIKEINLSDVLDEANLTMDELISLGILLGTDYCDNKRVSPTKAYQLVKKYEHINEIESIGHNCDNAIDYFKNPPVNDIHTVDEISDLKTRELFDFLKKFNFSEKYIGKIFKSVGEIEVLASKPGSNCN